MKYFDYKQMLQKSDDTTRACKKKKKTKNFPSRKRAEIRNYLSLWIKKIYTEIAIQRVRISSSGSSIVLNCVAHGSYYHPHPRASRHMTESHAIVHAVGYQANPRPHTLPLQHRPA